MRTYKITALIVLIIAFALFTRNNAHAIGRRAHPILAAFRVVQSGSQLQILAPKPGQKISNNSVTLRYALQPTATVQSSPTFQLRLDANDTVQVSDSSYTFTGLRPGSHSVTVQVLDANGTPVPNTQTQVQFTIVAEPAVRPGESLSEASTLPEPRNNALSILGVVGFGVLVGGALSLYRTRSNDSHHRRAEDI